MATVTETPGAAITWGSASFTWNSPGDSTKTWATATLSAWDVTENQGIIITESSVTRDIGKAIAEAFAFAEVLTKDVGLALADSFAFAEAFNSQDAFNINVGESIAFSESVTKNFGIAKSETIAFAETIVKQFGLNKSDAVNFAENFGRIVAFNLSLAETVNFAETIAKNIGLNKAEAVAFVDELRKKPLAVISDMLLTDGDVSLEDFEKLIENGHAPGYEDFKPFIDGDYEYRRAIFRTILTSSSLDRAKLEELALAVDVPDVHDSGTGTISAGQAATGITINFNRPFHIIPDVQLTLKGGTTVAIPRLESVSNISFTVKLLDPTTWAGVAGSFTWAADGY